MNNYYSENALQEMKEFDIEMAKINEEFSRLTPEQFDSWDPEDDYIPELDDIKPVNREISDKDKQLKNKVFKFDEELEWKEEYNLELDTDINEDTENMLPDMYEEE